MTNGPAPEQLSFRPLTGDDMTMVEQWLNQPHVAEWWGDATQTLEELNGGITEDHVGASWIMEIEGEAIGFIQWYRVEDEASWFPGLDIPPGTVALDVAIGDPDAVGRGHGRRLVLEFIHHVLRSNAAEATEVWIDPDPRNERAVRAYRAAGFIDTGIDLPDLDHPGQVRRLMKMSWAGPTFR